MLPGSAGQRSGRNSRELRGPALPALRQHKGPGKGPDSGCTCPGRSPARPAATSPFSAIQPDRVRVSSFPCRSRQPDDPLASDGRRDHPGSGPRLAPDWHASSAGGRRRSTAPSAGQVLSPGEGLRSPRRATAKKRWRRCSVREVDVIVADLRMPRMDGMEMYAALEATRPDLARSWSFSREICRSWPRRDRLQIPSSRILLKPVESQDCWRRRSTGSGADRPGQRAGRQAPPGVLDVR